MAMHTLPTGVLATDALERFVMHLCPLASCSWVALCREAFSCIIV